MRLPRYGQEASGGTPERPAFAENDILHEKHINLMMHSLYHLLEKAGVEALGEDKSFDANDPNTYNRVFEAIVDIINSSDSAYQPGDLIISSASNPRPGAFDLYGARITNGWNDYHELASSGSSLITQIGDDMQLKDLRGEFLRGWDNGRGVDIGRLLGTYQKASLIIGNDNADDAVWGGFKNAGGRKNMLGWEAPDLSDVSNEHLAQWVSAPEFSVPITSGIGKTGTGSVRARNYSVIFRIKW